MDQTDKTEQNGDKSFSDKALKPPRKSLRKRSERREPGRMPADVLAKLIIAAVTALLLLVFLLSFLVPSSQKPAPKGTSSPSHEGKLEYARKKRREGKDLIRKAGNSSSTTTRNSLLKQAEEIFWESRGAYSELIDAHDEEAGYEYLEKEREDVQMNIYHCQKTRTIVGYN